jgi:hypothetical protein
VTGSHCGSGGSRNDSRDVSGASDYVGNNAGSRASQIVVENPSANEMHFNPRTHEANSVAEQPETLQRSVRRRCLIVDGQYASTVR